MAVSTGAIRSMISGATGLTPVLQVLDVRTVNSGATTGAADRHKIMLSDGEHSILGMVTSGLNPLCASGEVHKFCLVNIEQYLVQELQGRKLVIITAMNVAQPSTGAQIGTPVAWSASTTTAAPPAAAAAPVPPAAASRAVVPNGVTMAHQPIASLNPYSNKWTIKARVTNRSDIRTWSNARGEGKLFSVELLDEHATEIRATFFRDAVDKFYPMLEEGGVFYFGNGKLKLANKRFSSIKNDYEITFDDRAAIQPAADAGSIAKQHFDFVPLAKLAETTPGTTVDAIGLVADVGELTSLTTKAGKEVEKRDLTLVDDSKASITLTLWGEKARQPTETFTGVVVAVKGCKLGDYNGRSMSTYASSTVMMNPDIPETARIRSWEAAGGASSGVTSLTERGSGGGGGPTQFADRKMLSAIQDEGLGRSERGDYITVKAHLTNIRHGVERPPWYPANPDADETGRKTHKKLSEAGDGTWIDERTGKRHTEPDWRYILSVSLCDESGTVYGTCFNEVGEKLLGKTATEMYAIYKAGLPEGGAQEGAEISDPRWNATFEKPMFSEWIFTLKVKIENVNDEERVKTTVIRMNPVSYATECASLSEAIGKFPA